MQLSLLASVLPGNSLAFISLPGGYEWIVIGALGLLIFGKRLPGAARGIGQSILEFKKGMKSGGGDDAEHPEQLPDESADRKPRFDPQTGKPVSQDGTATA